jgi:hypothetical protein
MIVSVLVKPGSKKGPLVEAAPSFDGLIVYLREKAHDGEANEALVRVLADYYHVAKSCVSIRRGQKSHQKMVEIIKK